MSHCWFASQLSSRRAAKYCIDLCAEEWFGTHYSGLRVATCLLGSHCLEDVNRATSNKSDTTFAFSKPESGGCFGRFWTAFGNVCSKSPNVAMSSLFVSKER